jgi:hypothetical protein
MKTTKRPSPGKTHIVFCVDWVYKDSWSDDEPDGFSLHLRDEDFEKFCEDRFASRTAQFAKDHIVPECYETPGTLIGGSPRYPVQVSHKTYLGIRRSKYGIRVYGKMKRKGVIPIFEDIQATSGKR